MPPVGTFDPWSMRNQRPGPGPASRRLDRGDERGVRDIPIIDWRPYLEEVLDMHNSHQSFASRQRMLDHDGRASNQVIWFS